MSKIRLHLMGLITLLVFPIPAFLAVYFMKGSSFSAFIQADKIGAIPIGYGIEFGIVYAFLAILIQRAPVFEKIPLPVDKLIRELHLNDFDAIVLSLCAGIGEELLFRAGIQPFLGIWPTSIFFVAIHGYFSVKKPIKSLYGLLVLPFIILISYGYEYFGLWFSIAAHFAYDWTLFTIMIREED